MGLFDRFRRSVGEIMPYDPIRMARGARLFSDAFFGGNGLMKICQGNAYHLARSMAEVAYPIDMIADRVATLKYHITNDSDKIVERLPKDVERLIERPNAFASLATLMYEAAFLLMADGNLVGVRTRPEIYEDAPVKPDNIFSVNIPKPHYYTIHWNRGMRSDLVANIGELIEYVKISEDNHHIEHRGIDVEYIGNGGSFEYRHECGGWGYRSPLLTAERNINNLIAVYQARYRAYTDNPMGIILSPKQALGSDIASVALGSGSRDKIQKDLQERYGITGYDVNGEKKNFWALTSTPLQATKTLATIAELQPFEETREDAVAIAGIFDVDNSLVPSRERAAFTTDNKEAAEANLYDGIITTMANDVADFFSKLLGLNAIGLKLTPDMTNVPVLQKRRLQKAQSDTQVVDLLIKMRDANMIDEASIKVITERITNNLKI